MITNHLFRITIIFLYFTSQSIFAQCIEGAVPTDYSSVDENFFNNYNPPAATAGTEVLIFNPEGGKKSAIDDKDNPDSIMFQIDGHGSIQIRKYGQFHYFNKSYRTLGLAAPLTGLDDQTHNGFAIIYGGHFYGPDVSNFYDEHYKNKSISQITGDGSVDNPWQAKIEYYADVNANNTYDVTDDILVTEIVTLRKTDNFLRRDRLVTPPTGTNISTTNPIKMFEQRDAAFTGNTDAGYGVYSLSGIGRARMPRKTSAELHNGFGSYIEGETVDDINFIGITNKEITEDSNIYEAVLLGISEITPWKKWYIGFYNAFTASPSEPSKFSLRDGEEPNNYMVHWNYDIGFGIFYEDITSNSAKVVSFYEAVTNPCPLAPQILEQPQSQGICGNTQIKALKVEAIPYEEGRGLTYQWYKNTTNSNQNGTAIQGATQASYTPTDIPTAGNSLYYYVEITEEGGLKSKSRVAEISLSAQPTFVQQPADTTIDCVSGNATFSFSATFTPATGWKYQLEKQNGTSWEDVANATGSVVSGNVTGITLSNASTGTYRIRLEGLGASCKAHSNSANITPSTAVPAPVLANSNLSFCASENKKVSDLNLATGVNPQGNITWYDMVVGGTALDINAVLKSGSYFAETIQAGCKSQRTEARVVVTIVGKLSYRVVQTCVKTATIEFSGLPSGNWILKEINGKIPNKNGNSQTITVTEISNGEEYQFVVEAAGCQSEATPLITIPHTICAVDDVFSVEANTTIGSILENDLYDTNPITGSSVVVSVSPESAWVSGFSIDANGVITVGNIPQGTYRLPYKICEGTICSTGMVTVNITKGYVDIEIPEYFTPNGDGIEDTWGPKSTIFYPKIRTQIYDRYGRVLKVLKEGEQWDGYYNGVRMPAGAYWYTIDLKSLNNKQRFFGHFTIF